MQTLSPEQLLEIARRVAETFDTPDRWHKGSWGRDDDGYRLSFDGGFHVEDENGRRPHPGAPHAAPRRRGAVSALPAPSGSTPGQSPGCDPSGLGDLIEQICLVYVNVGKLHRHLQFHDTFEPYLGRRDRMERPGRAVFPGNPAPRPGRRRPPRRGAIPDGLTRHAETMQKLHHPPRGRGPQAGLAQPLPRPAARLPGGAAARSPRSPQGRAAPRRAPVAPPQGAHGLLLAGHRRLRGPSRPRPAVTRPASTSPSSRAASAMLAGRSSPSTFALRTTDRAFSAAGLSGPTRRRVGLRSGERRGNLEASGAASRSPSTPRRGLSASWRGVSIPRHGAVPCPSPAPPSRSPTCRPRRPRPGTQWTRAGAGTSRRCSRPSSCWLLDMEPMTDPAITDIAISGNSVLAATTARSAVQRPSGLAGRTSSATCAAGGEVCGACPDMVDALAVKLRRAGR